jgi:small subunit ribosomal protein S1
MLWATHLVSTAPVAVIVVDAAKRHLKLSVRKVQPAPVDALRARFPVGAKVTGRVKNVASFGVFVVLDQEWRGVAAK